MNSKTRDRRLVGIEDWLGSKTTGDQRLVWIEDLLGSKTCWDQRLEIEDKVRWERRLGDALGSKTWDQRLGIKDFWGQRLGVEDLGSKTWDQRLVGINDWVVGIEDLGLMTNYSLVYTSVDDHGLVSMDTGVDINE
mgnify:CR=1 FL=1